MEPISSPNNNKIAKPSLQAHKWLGLAISAAMYLICLSGTLVVFDQELERWEQPNILESESFTTEQISSAYDDFTERYKQETSHMHVVFPSSGIPRLVVENDHIAHFVLPNGSLGEIEKPYWTKMLVDLHLYLHLPKNFGMILVSALGALLCALIISGFFAHPRIIKDAFRFRRGGTGMQENSDLHNRLSVWASPFHFMISITGAYYGLIGVLVFVLANAFYNGDMDKIWGKLFTPEPQLEQSLQTPNLGKAIDYVHMHDPSGKLIFLTVHEPHTPRQFIEIYVKQPGRLIYSENYRFDVDGHFIGKSGYSDGEFGKQTVYSMYRLHFGDFAGIKTKLFYFVLGMMLTIVSATGINIWLAKRKTRDIINILWPSFVWSVPLALVVSAIFHLYTSARVDFSLWAVLVACLSVSLYAKDEFIVKALLKKVLSVSIIIFCVLYSVKYGYASLSTASLQINLPLFVFSLVLAYWSFRNATALKTKK